MNRVVMNHLSSGNMLETPIPAVGMQRILLIRPTEIYKPLSQKNVLVHKHTNTAMKECQ